MPNLYELSQEYIAVSEAAKDEPEKLADHLELITGDVNEKGVNIVKVVNGLDSDIETIDKEIKRLQAIKKSRTNAKERLKSYLIDNMTACGISKIECPLFTVTMRKPSKVVTVTDVDSIPDEFVKIEVKEAPDKQAIAKALKAGKDVPGAKLEDGKPSILIK